VNAQALPPASPWQSGSAGDESAHVFGDGLVGVITRPGADAARGDVAVILLNAGLVQRSGPHRGSVQLARSLATRGFAVLRFDQSGLGDSPVPANAGGDRRGRELAAAIELLARETGASRFVVGGICSAADTAFRLAATEQRVHGLLLLDGPGYRTPGWWLRYLPPRLLQPRKLWSWWRQRGSGVDMANFRDFPSRGEAVARTQAFAARGGRMLLVYTGGAYRYFNHAGQVRCFGRAARSPAVTSAYWRDCDHTFYLARDRQRLQALVGDWLEHAFTQSPRSSHTP